MLKRITDTSLSVIAIPFLLPVCLLIAFLIKKTSPGPVIFKQKRVGRHGHPFTIYKFRTMVKNAESLQTKYQHLSETDGPAFKIRNDPRLTKFGKILSHTGLDELPQLINVLKGEMSLVGPRPLPVAEEAQINEKIQLKRRRVRPGLCSSWLVNGAHNLSFRKWMELDLADIRGSSLTYDFMVLFKTIGLSLALVKNELAAKIPITLSQPPQVPISPSDKSRATS